MSKKTFLAIADIHGEFRALQRMMERLEGRYDLENPDIQLVFLGDYIDRGESSLKVIEGLSEIKKRFSQTIQLMGNHELMYMQGYRDRSCDIPDPTPKLVKDFFSQLGLFHESDHFLFVHGGPETPDMKLEDHSIEQLLWNYSPSRQGWNGKMVVKGHTPVEYAGWDGNVLYLDTRCGYSAENPLTCVALDDQSGELIETIQAASCELLEKESLEEKVA